MISTSPIRISCLVRAEHAEKAVQVLHAAFELDEAGAASGPSGRRKACH